MLDKGIVPCFLPENPSLSLQDKIIMYVRVPLPRYSVVSQVLTGLVHRLRDILLLPVCSLCYAAYPRVHGSAAREGARTVLIPDQTKPLSVASMIKKKRICQEDKHVDCRPEAKVGRYGPWCYEYLRVVCMLYCACALSRTGAVLLWSRHAVMGISRS